MSCQETITLGDLRLRRWLAEGFSLGGDDSAAAFTCRPPNFTGSGCGGPGRTGHQNDTQEACFEQDPDARAEALRGEIKWKHAMHLMRLCRRERPPGLSALRASELPMRLHEHRDAVVDIKRCEQPWPEVNA